MNKANKFNIFLIGPSGAGKSTIGREIAKIFALEFYDTDHVIRQRTGVEIAWIFDIEGEAGFHQRELALIKELAPLSNTLIATGGITILSELNREIIKENGLVIYLKAGLQEQFQRTSRNQSTRPLLRGNDIKNKLIEMAKSCEPFYESLADLTFETDKQTVSEVTKKIADQLRKQGYPST